MAVQTTGKAFPSALGAGASATGGSGGAVIHVTTLNWSGAGSLKAALQTTGTRTIVFDVSGEIDATSESAFVPIINGASYNNITIAGQTAPNGGITIRTSEFQFENVDNIIIRYVRFRQASNSNQDAVWMLNTNNVIFDHCTFSHGGDEAMSIAGSSLTSGDVTVQNCFFQDSKTGSILGVDNVAGNFTFVSNAYSNVSHRFPNPKGNGQYDIINNVVYNWRDRLVRITGEGTYNVINNYYKPSANGLRLQGWFGNGTITNLQKLQTQAADNPLIYTSGSIVVGQRETPQTDDSNMWRVFDLSHLPVNTQVPAQYFTATQFPLVGQSYAIKTAAQAYIDVLSDVGANKTLNDNGSINTYQDTKDAADLLMMQNDTYSGVFYGLRSTIPYPTIPINTRTLPADGIPTAWRTANMSGQLGTALAPSGYTWLEEFLNSVDGVIVGSIPIITLVGASTINLNNGDTYTELGATANDVEDGVITGSIVTTGTINTAIDGTYYKYYNVTDSDGNAASQLTRTIIVTTLGGGNIPVITLNGASTINLNNGDTYTELGATASDIEDGSLTGSIVITGTVNTAVDGTYYKYYNVADSNSNNAVQIVRTINVTTPGGGNITHTLTELQKGRNRYKRKRIIF